MRLSPDDIMRGPSDRPTLDRLLRFDAGTKAIYEAEHGVARAAHLRHTVSFGLLLYVLHDISVFLLLPDEYWIIFLATIFVIVPSSLAVAYSVAKVSSEVREIMVLGAILSATALPVFMLYYSNAPHSTHMNVEVILCIVFANMLMALRFRYALAYSLMTLFAAILAVSMKNGVAPNLKIALCFQFTSVCILTVYANYLFERRRCSDYCISLEAKVRAETAETSGKQFQVMSKTDALTGLPNRRFLDERLEEWCAGRRSVVIMMIDVDHFKLFNDTLGHLAGDDCLRVIGETFNSAFNEPDLFCARFGGEEFTVVVRGAGELQVARLASAIVRSIEALGIPHPGRSDGVDVVTASIGVAFKHKGVTGSPAELLSQADDALYKAKRRGRNCYVVGDPARPGMPISASLGAR